MFCESCGAKIDDDSKFCLVCGKSVSSYSAAPQINTNSATSTSSAENKSKRKMLLGLIVIFIIFFAIISIAKTSSGGSKKSKNSDSKMIKVAKNLCFFSSDYRVEDVLEKFATELNWQVVKIDGKKYVEVSGPITLASLFTGGSDYVLGLYFSISKDGSSIEGGYIKALGMSDTLDTDETISQLKTMYDAYGIMQFSKNMDNLNDSLDNW